MPVIVGNGKNAARQRGYAAACGKRPSHPPADAEMAAAYLRGYRSGQMQRRDGDLDREQA